MIGLNSQKADLQKSMVLYTKANGFRDAGNLVAAAEVYQRAIRACPMNGLPYYDLMAMLMRMKDLPNVVKVLQAIPADLYRQSKPLQYMHALLVIETGEHRKGAEILKGCEGVAGISQGELYNNIGTCFNRLEEYESAMDYYEKAFRAGHRTVEFYQNWAGTYQKQGNVSAAEKKYREAVRLHPDSGDLLYEYAIFLLKCEDFKAGFDLYPNRWRARSFADRRHEFPIPKWDGSAYVDSLAVVGEQGIGDLLVYSALLPAIKERVGKITLAFDPRLDALLRRSFPYIEMVNMDALSGTESSTRFDAFISAGDLGRVAPDAVGWRHGYLSPDKAKAGQLREKYERLFPGRTLVGISWKSKRAIYGERKTVEIEHWGAVLKLRNVQFINLQYGDVSEELRQAKELFGVDIYADPEIDTFNDIDGLAAQIAALDQVITTSNSTAHVAGAIDAPTWVILPHGAGLLWYWGYREKHAPWYPHVRLFRVEEVRAWAPVMDKVKAALCNKFEGVS